MHADEIREQAGLDDIKLLTLEIITVGSCYASIRFLWWWWWRRRVFALCADGLPATAVVLGEPLPATPLGLVKLSKHVKPIQEMNQDKYDIYI